MRVRDADDAGLQDLSFALAQAHDWQAPNCLVCGQPEYWSFYRARGWGRWRLSLGRCLNC